MTRPAAPRLAGVARLLFLGVTLSACAQATEIVLVVDTDLGVPGELTRVEIDVLNDRTAAVRTGVDFTVPGAIALPLVLGITARREAAPVVVSVRGFLDSGDIITREVRTTIVPGASRMLRILLTSRCAGRVCPLGETCDETGCRAIEVAGADLPAWTGGVGRVDGEACVPQDERCNLYDDDCDDVVDEGITLLSDPANCGRCGRGCSGGPCANGFCDGETPERIAAGGAHTCVVREGGGVACLGWNLDGQLATPGIESRPLPTEVLVAGAASVAAGGAFTCVLNSTGQIRCFGDGDAGALGSGAMSDLRTPTLVSGSSLYAALAAGAGHACAATTLGTVECWGRNEAAQLGDGTAMTALSPVLAWPAELTGITAVAAGFRHSCALRGSDGAVLCWGSDGRGQLGDGTVGGVLRPPVQVVGLDMVTAIAAGRSFTCALRLGAVHCWGANDLGQLGASGALESATPIEVTGITDATAIAVAAGGTHACALRAAGVVSCWGSNASGQLGDGTTNATTDPVDVMNLPAAIAIAAGGLDDVGSGHTCAILGAGGGVRCWGEGGLGQNGSAAGEDLPMATPVAGFP